MKPKLFVMWGPAGCGKTTWVKNHLTDADVWVSRDEIRFDFLEHKGGQDYFAYEDLVKKIYYKQINWALSAGLNTFADATHGTKKSRAELLRRIKDKDVEKYIICFNIPLQTTLEQNAKREGLAHVPEQVIKNMYKTFQPPTLDEGFDKIYIIEPDGRMRCKERS